MDSFRNYRLSTTNYQLLDLFYPDFRKSLPVALLTFVLFAALFLENDDLFAAAVPYNSGCNRAAPDLRVASSAKYECIEIDLFAGFGVDRRNLNCLARFDRELFAAGPNYCVTHSFTSPFGVGAKSSISRKVQIIRTQNAFVNAGGPFPGYCRKSYVPNKKTCVIIPLNKPKQRRKVMEHAASLTDLNSDEAKVAEMRMGANWFFWIAILAVASSLIVYFYSFTNHLIGLGINHYFESQAANDSGRLFALSMSFLFAAVLAGFGYYARKGGDFVFILGAFLYLADGVILLGYREFFAFAFHIFAMYFIFKGLLASRRRYDPSVDATGA